MARPAAASEHSNATSALEHLETKTQRLREAAPLARYLEQEEQLDAQTGRLSPEEEADARRELLALAKLQSLNNPEQAGLPCEPLLVPKAHLRLAQSYRRLGLQVQVRSPTDPSSPAHQGTLESLETCSQPAPSLALHPVLGA